jgi:SAM-dependent methyltransferase
MVRSARHPMLAQPTHDESSRQEFVVSFKQYLNRDLRPRNRGVFEREAAPAFAARTGHAPASRAEIADAMYRHPHYQAWSRLARTAQELMWDAVYAPIRREKPRLTSTLHALTDPARRRGTLELDPSCERPRGLERVHVHLQPGGYLKDEGPDDFDAGALYEAGGNLYAFGQGIGRRDSKAAAVQAFIAQRYPELQPRRILDMGCSAGSATVPYAEAFPGAEVYGIDVGAGLLRYAHARAEALGARVHFKQRSVADTKFTDGYFDLVVSHNLFHESSDATRRRALQETFRILRPGGVCVHQDVPLRFDGRSEFDKFELSWDQRHNGEPYWEAYANADLEADLCAAGFPPAATFVGHLEARPGSLPWFVSVAQKPSDRDA